MKTQKTYKCQLTGYCVEYLIHPDKTTAETGFVWSDYENIKAWLSLIRHSIDKLKEEGIQYIIQRIDQQEWINHLKGKTSWEIISTDNKYNTYVIKCSVDTYLENYGVGIGL